MSLTTPHTCTIWPEAILYVSQRFNLTATGRTVRMVGRGGGRAGGASAHEVVEVDWILLNPELSCRKDAEGPFYA